MADAPDPLWWDAWRGVLFTQARILRLAEQDLEERVGFSVAWLDILSRLHSAPEQRLRMQELQERSLFTFGGMTRLVDRIERAGLVTRERVPGDRRGVYVVLTEAGRIRHDEAFAGHMRLIEREFGGRLTDAQQRAVAEALYSFWHEPPPESR